MFHGEAEIRGENGLLTRQTFGRSFGKVAESNLSEEIREMGIPANNSAFEWGPQSGPIFFRKAIRKKPFSRRCCIFMLEIG